MSDQDIVDIRISGAEDIAAAARRFKEAGRGDLRKAMKKEIREQARPLLEDLKSAVTALAVTGARGGGSRARSAHRGGRGRNHGLRRTIAGAIQLKITDSGRSTGVRVRIDRSKLPADQRNLPEALNKPGGWRHPVFGHDVWVQQTGGQFWEPTVDRHGEELRGAILRAVQAHLDDLERDIT